MPPSSLPAARALLLAARTRWGVAVIVLSMVGGLALATTSPAAAADGIAAGPAPGARVAATSTISGLIPVEPSREVDTRRGLGGGLLRVGERRFLPMPSVSTDATGVVVNVTVTDASASGHLVVDDCSPDVSASAVNFVPGRAVPNQVVVGLAVDGRRGICVRSSADANLIVDLFGLIGPGGATVRSGVARLHDTRSQGGIGADGVLRVDLGGVVASTGPSGTVAWTGTVTATDVTAPGYVTAWPCAARRPEVSQLNLVVGMTSANQVTVEVPASDPTLCLRRVGQAHLIVDSTGVWTTPSQRVVRPVAPPRRVVDSRHGDPVAPGEIRRVHAAVDAVLMINLTATRSAAPGWVAVFECGAGHQGTSTVNLVPGIDIAGSATVAAGSDGVCVTASARTDVIVDVFAVQQPTGTTALPVPGVPLIGEIVRPGIAPDPATPVVSGCLVGSLDGMNAARRAAGLAPLVSDARTASFACQWATHMASVDRMAHSTRDLRAEIDACGVNAENVARGNGGWEWMMGAWLESPSHRANVLHSALGRASVAYVSRTEGDRIMWFGATAFGGSC